MTFKYTVYTEGQVEAKYCVLFIQLDFIQLDFIHVFRARYSQILNQPFLNCFFEKQTYSLCIIIHLPLNAKNTESKIQICGLSIVHVLLAIRSLPGVS